MGCRCSDIRRVNADLRTLSRAERKLSKMDDAASDIEEATSSLTSALSEATEVDTSSVSKDIYSKDVRSSRDAIASSIVSMRRRSNRGFRRIGPKTGPITRITTERKGRHNHEQHDDCRRPRFDEDIGAEGE